MERLDRVVQTVPPIKLTGGCCGRGGLVARSWSLDHVGPITRTVEDAAILLDAIAGRHPDDPASHDTAVHDNGAAIGNDLDGLRIGVPRNCFFDRITDDVEAATYAAIDRLAERGARLIPVTVSSTDLFHAVQWALMVSEASSYHSTRLHTSADLYGDDVRILLEAGEHMLATDYLAGLRARTHIVRSWYELFSSIDLLAAPSTPNTAAAVDQTTFTWRTGETEVVADAYVHLSAPANLTGRPAISVPSGFDSAGLPIGFQLVGQPFEETRLLQAAAAVAA
ncbi:amidase family protein [Nocardia rhamnosiphila]|uniref:amidase n=1 Tax=Nocardia rhamnosiphila TaxID=426716 RepID=UPI0027E2CC65|nr:amidase family protein [Nocardia zapadnayensis]